MMVMRGVLGYNAGMSISRRKPMTVEEFLDWERRQDLRYEFDGFQAVAMTGGTANHAVIADNLMDGLRQRLKSPCRAFRSDLKVRVNGRVRYPDAVVTCSPVPGTTDTVPNPVMVFEVLSPSTASVDRVVKNTEYEATSSIQRYVMLEQNQIAATVFHRDGERWIGTVLRDNAMLVMPEIGVELPLPDLYVGVELPPPETDD
jgi:Uma2 family endonuclease